jgi:hypothetical protein
MTKTAGLPTTAGGDLGVVAPAVDRAWDVAFKRMGVFGQETCHAR